MSKTAKPRAVVFLLYEGVQLLDVAGAAEVFAQAGTFTPDGGYAVSYVGPAGHVGSSAGLTLSAEPFDTAPDEIHTLVVPGAPQGPLEAVLGDRASMDWLAAAAPRAGRIASVCSGAFLLASIGLLDGRRAATHWVATDQLAKRHPKVRVDREALFVEDGHIWTAAGVTSGIDLALALVTRDLGAEVAMAVARALVLHLVRPGGQSQFSAPLSLQARGGPDLARLIPWLEARLDAEVQVEAMAQAMGMSERSFHRRCVEAFGLPPGKLMAQLRFDRARTLLEDARTPLPAVAAGAGFTDAPAFSKAFAKRYGASPGSYRRAFARG